MKKFAKHLILLTSLISLSSCNLENIISALQVFETSTGASNVISNTTEDATSTYEATTNTYTSTNTATSGGVNVAVTGVSLDKNTATIDLKETNTLQLTATVSPSNATNKGVTWTSSVTSVATVDQNGLVTALKTGTTSITVKSKENSAKYSKCTLTVKNTTPTVSSVTLSSTNLSLTVGGTSTLTATVTGTNSPAKTVTWKSSSPTIASVNNGVVTALAVGTTTITATSTADSTKSATCSVTVKEAGAQDAWTILMYICGSNLESDSDGGLATADLKEICSVSNQPDDVNIVVQTGGASKWRSTYGISANYSERWHVENKTLVRDEQNKKVNMGLSTTLASFVSWGINKYPADKIGLIFWNHGGAMEGVCYDEQYSDDVLTNAEVKTALTSAFSTLGRTEKLEFIGYDACLMGVQDVADFNSNFANYMVASEESEAGEGWDYDNWIDDIYAKKDTVTCLKSICTSFIADFDSTYGGQYTNDQTLSVLDLSKAAAYRTAWESMAEALSTKWSGKSKSTITNFILNNTKHFGDTDYDRFALFDSKDFINKLAKNSTYAPDSSYTTAVLNAFNDYVIHSSKGSGAGNAYGLGFIWGNSNTYGAQNYNTSNTNFTNWRSLMSSYGYL